MIYILAPLLPADRTRKFDEICDYLSATVSPELKPRKPSPTRAYFRRSYNREHSWRVSTLYWVSLELGYGIYYKIEVFPSSLEILLALRF